MDPNVIQTLNAQIRDLNDLLTKQAASLSSLSENIKRSKSTMDAEATAASQSTTTQNLQTQYNLNRTSVLNARTRAIAEADKLMATRLSNLNSAINHTKNAVSQATDAVLSGEQGFGKYGGTLRSLGGAASSLGKNFGVLGTVLGTFFNLGLQVAEKQAKQVDDVAKATDSIAKLGVINSFSMSDVLTMGHQAGLTAGELDKMIKPMQSVQGGFIGLGRTQSEGIKRFGALINVSEKVRNQYRRLGMDDEARNQAFADFISAQNMAGESYKGELSTDKGLQNAADAYITNLYELADLTHKSVSDMGKERMSMMHDQAVILETYKLNEADAKVAEILKNGTPEQKARAQKEKERIDNERNGLKTLMDTLQERGVDQKTSRAALTAYYTGVVDKSLQSFTLSGMNFSTVIDKLKAGQLDRGQLANEIQTRDVAAINSIGLTTLTSNQELASNLNKGKNDVSTLNRINQTLGTDREQTNQDAKTEIAQQKSSTDPVQINRDREVEGTRKLKIATDNLLWSTNPFSGSSGIFSTLGILTVAAATALMGIPVAVGISKLGRGTLGKLGKGIAIGTTAMAAGAATIGLGSLTSSILHKEDEPKDDDDDSDISSIPEENEIKPEDQANTKLQAINKKIVEQSKQLNTVTKQLTQASSKLAKEETARQLEIISKYKFDPVVIETNSKAVAAYNTIIGDAASLSFDSVDKVANMMVPFSAAFVNFCKALDILSGQAPSTSGNISPVNITKNVGEISGKTPLGKYGGAIARNAVEFIAKFEGFRGKAYIFPGEKLYTIGYGHVIQPNEISAGRLPNGVPILGPLGRDTVLTKEQAQALLEYDLPKYEQPAAAAVGSGWNNMNQAQKAAFASYAYNTGPGGVRSFIKRNNISQLALQKDWAGIAAAFRDRGVKTGSGKFLQGLANRRAAEAQAILQARTGGLFTGPLSGYPMELHGTEIVIPMAQNSILAKMATETQENSSTAKAAKTATKNLGLNQEMITNLARKFDDVIYVLSESDSVHDKILRHSSV